MRGSLSPTVTETVGRFAPSPTGDLHLGSLLAAMASYCEARSKNGRWLLRIDDIDPPRSVKGSAAAIQRTLEQYGFEWDEPVIWQSQRMGHYRDALQRLVDAGRLFCCGCSRKTLPTGQPYPGYCRDHRLHSCESQRPDTALRLHLHGEVHFIDRFQGEMHIDLASQVGDIIVWRRDGLVSYSLACAVDDATLSSEVVRGADLLDSSAAQIAIIQLLGQRPPHYAHVPVLLNQRGDKLSKHSKAPLIASQNTLDVLHFSWQLLGQQVFRAETRQAFWKHALMSWDSLRVPTSRRLTI